MVLEGMEDAPYFYSRPCGRGDAARLMRLVRRIVSISTHAPAGGATFVFRGCIVSFAFHFYSRPCGRGDRRETVFLNLIAQFLLTPLREGRPCCSCGYGCG